MLEIALTASINLERVVGNLYYYKKLLVELIPAKNTFTLSSIFNWKFFPLPIQTRNNLTGILQAELYFLIYDLFVLLCPASGGEKTRK